MMTPKQSVIQALKMVLADSYALYTKTQNYHWNVQGIHFKTVHELLESHYTDLASAIDNVAEMIRMLGDKAPGTWTAYAAITKIKEGDEQADCITMLHHLAQDQKVILDTLAQGIHAAQKAGDEVIVGALTERMAVHRKNHWFLESMLK